MITTKVVLLIINYKFILFYTIILIGQISSIIYKPKKNWASGGIGRRVGLRNQYGNM